MATRQRSIKERNTRRHRPVKRRLKHGKSPLKDSETSEESDDQQSGEENFLADDPAAIREFERKTKTNTGFLSSPFQPPGLIFIKSLD